MKPSKAATSKSVLNRMYNQDMAPEDSEVTFFYYHKTLVCIQLPRPWSS